VILDQQRRLITDVVLTEDGHAQERSGIARVLYSVSAGDGFPIVIAKFWGLRPADSRRPVDRPMLVYDPSSGEALPVRRLTLALKEPTRDGDTVWPLLTNVPAQEARAGKLVGVYGKRWTIETAFFELTTTLSCEIRT
jgi:hypothetical protein